jgi:hypothetical protein
MKIIKKIYNKLKFKKFKKKKKEKDNNPII